MPKKTDQTNKPHVLVIGNPVDGFQFIGPYPTHQDALDDAEGRDDGWWIARLYGPDED